jgi:polyhydroxyalkanoate synthesis repressor PhaR
MSLPPHADFNQAAPAQARISEREPTRIRKYPNRRLYDTSRSRHLTHQGVLDLIAAGHVVEVTDSRTGADITNVVLLQILIERDPARLGAIPTALLHRLMRSGPAEVRDACARAMRSLTPDAPLAAGVGGNNHHAPLRQLRPEIAARTE